MRATTMVVGMALALAACGGKGEEQKPADGAPAAPAPAAATGATHEVAMDFDGKKGTLHAHGPDHQVG